MSMGGGSHADAQSRAFSADQLEKPENVQVVPKTIIAYLNDKITTFMMTGQDEELRQIKIEGDLVTSFFDSVDKLSDPSLY